MWYISVTDFACSSRSVAFNMIHICWRFAVMRLTVEAYDRLFSKNISNTCKGYDGKHIQHLYISIRYILNKYKRNKIIEKKCSPVGLCWNNALGLLRILRPTWSLRTGFPVSHALSCSPAGWQQNPEPRTDLNPINIRLYWHICCRKPGFIKHG